MKQAYCLLIVFFSFWAQMARGGEPLNVVTLSSVLTDFVKNVGGQAVEITPMVKPGQDPHEFNPTTAQMRKMSEARLIFASGKGMEGYLPKLRDTAKSQATIVDVGAAVPSVWVEKTCDHDHAHPHDHAHSADGKVEDPHWWHSIPHALAAVKTIRDALIKADPAQKALFEKNAAAYIGKLEELEKWTDAQIALIPRDKRILVTSHDALGYFGKAYGFDIHSIEGVTTADTPTSKHVTELIAQIKAEGVKAIFAENISNPKVQRQIEKETGARLAGTLYADGLGKGDADTFIGMYRHNVSTIVDALK